MKRRIYLPFHIQIVPAVDGYRTRVLDSPAGQASAEFQRPPLLDDPASWQSDLWQHGQRFGGSSTKSPIKAVGIALFAALFHDDVLVGFTQSLALARNQEAGLRIKLHLGEVPELANLPWEYLYYSALNRFLALSIDTTLVHYLDLPRNAPPLAVTLPLRVLAVMASPRDLQPLDTAREWANLQASLGELEQYGLVQLECIEEASLSALQSALRRQTYHVLHFAGHGAFSSDGQDGALMFCDANGQADLVTGRELGMILGDAPSLRLVVLNACEGSLTSEANAFAGTAQVLVQQGIPAAIAMQSQISDAAAITLSREFYAALADGYPVDAALAEARKAISTRHKNGEWGIPRLLMHASDGMLWEMDAPAMAQEALAAQAVDTSLTILASVMRRPDMRKRVVALRTDFEAASEQIDLLSNYKDLHDLLHNLQFLCYNGIVQEARRFPEDETALGILMDHELTFQDFVTRLQEVAARPSMPASEMAWIQELVLARAHMQTAIEALDDEPLKRAMWLVKRVLDRHPTRINERLNAAARALRLATIQQAMASIRVELRRLHLGPEQVQQFEVGVRALGDLSRHLAALVDDHDSWQAIDLELRRIEAVMGHDLGELELSWPDLKAKVEPLCRDNAASWVEALHKDGDCLDRALAAHNPIKIRQSFQRYRRHAGNRFFQVDTDLKALCHELRSLGEPLSATFRMLV